jgi:hypothetical protein
VTYRAELSVRVFRQLGGFPPKAFDALISPMSDVVESPADPLRTFSMNDPSARCAVFGAAGLVTYVIDEAREIVTLTDVTWAG